MPVRCYIKNRADFIRVIRRGRIIRGDGWQLHYIQNRCQTPRLAVNISKRHVRHAVRRNRLRRQLRERFRQEWLSTLPKMDCLIRSTATPAAATNPCAATRRLLDDMLDMLSKTHKKQ